jgi:hypothetical protein
VGSIATRIAAPTVRPEAWSDDSTQSTRHAPSGVPFPPWEVKAKRRRKSIAKKSRFASTICAVLACGWVPRGVLPVIALCKEQVAKI